MLASSSDNKAIWESDLGILIRGGEGRGGRRTRREGGRGWNPVAARGIQLEEKGTHIRSYRHCCSLLVVTLTSTNSSLKSFHVLNGVFKKRWSPPCPSLDWLDSNYDFSDEKRWLCWRRWRRFTKEGGRLLERTPIVMHHDVESEEEKEEGGIINLTQTMFQHHLLLREKNHLRKVNWDALAARSKRNNVLKMCQVFLFLKNCFWFSLSKLMGKSTIRDF